MTMSVAQVCVGGRFPWQGGTPLDTCEQSYHRWAAMADYNGRNELCPYMARSVLLLELARACIALRNLDSGNCWEGHRA